jgi:hypothetical protein
MIEKCCRLAWAITIHCAQGASLEGRVRLHDLKNPFFTDAPLRRGLPSARTRASSECVE